MAAKRAGPAGRPAPGPHKEETLLADTPASDRSNLPDTTIGPRSRPADVGTAQPIIKRPAPEVLAVPPTSPAVRAGTPPADTPTQAVIRAQRVATTTPAGAEPEGMTTDQVMPTCMITVTLGGVALLALIMFGWMFGEISNFLQRLFQ